MRVQTAASSMENSHTLHPNPPTSPPALAHSLGCFVWSTNTGSEGTSIWLGSWEGSVAGIAATSRVHDCSCIEVPGPVYAHVRAGKKLGFFRSVLFLLWPEEQLLRGNNLTQDYTHSSPCP